MDSDPGEDTSDGRVEQSDKQNSYDPNLVIKQEVDIKEEPMESVELIEYEWESSTIEMNDSVKLENDIIDIGIKIKKEENRSEKGRGIPTKKSNDKGKRQRLHGKVNGRNRILTQKRNMANASKKSRTKQQKVQSVSNAITVH